MVVLDDPVDRLAEHGLHLRLVQLVDTGRVEGGGKAGVSGRTGTAFYLEYTGQDCLHWQFKMPPTKSAVSAGPGIPGTRLPTRYLSMLPSSIPFPSQRPHWNLKQCPVNSFRIWEESR